MDKEQIHAEIALLRKRLQNITDESQWCIIRLDELSQHIQQLASEPLQDQQADDLQENVPEVKPVAILENIYRAHAPADQDIPPAVEQPLVDIQESEAIKSPAMPPPKPKEAKANINEKLGEKKEKTPVEHFADSKITDLKKTFTINQKLSFIRHLFNNDAMAYNNVLDKINTAENYPAAEMLMIETISSLNDDIYAEFKSFVRRRFLP